MSEFIYDWLNNEVGMYPFITEFKEDFYNGYKFGNLLMKLGLIPIDYFNQNYIDSNDKTNINENYEKLMIDLKTYGGIELTPNMIQPILEKELTAALSLIYKIKVSMNKKKINFDQIRTFDIFADQEEIQKRFMDMASFGFDNESDEEKEITSTKKNKKIKFVDEKNDKKKINKHRGSMEELSIENIEDRNKTDFEDIKIPPEKGSIKINKSQRLKPIQSIVLKKNYKNHKNDINYLLSTNIDEENKKELENRFNVQSFSGNLNKIGFNINMGQLKYLNGSSNLDMSQNTVMLKVKEQLKERLDKKLFENSEKQTIEKNELQKSLFLPLPPQKEINFFDRKKNPLLNLNKEESSKNENLRYKSNNFETRLNYDNNLKLDKKYKTIEKRMNFFRSLMLKKKEQHELEKEKNKPSISVLRSTEKSFRKTFFFTELNDQPLERSLQIAEKKKNNIINDYPLIRKITYQIIDYAFQGYIYQEENNKELIDLPEFKDWNRRFVEGKPVVEPIFDAEEEEIKNLQLHQNKVKWTLDNEREILDYVNFAGEWDDRFIIPKEIRGKSIEFTDIYDNLNEDFEPTNNEIDDVSIPSNPVKDYKFSSLVYNVLDYKFKVNKNNNDEQKGKWDYIPIKIALLGYPLSGKKTQAELINSKFNHIKIISVFDYIKEKNKEWDEINEPIENHPKFKTLKPNQIDQMKEEQNKKIEDFKNNNEMIIDYIENTDENKKPSDELLLKILINKVESEFPIKNEEDYTNEIINRQKKINDLIEKLALLKEENAESKKPNLKEEQNLENEIENIQKETYMGFIISDFPKTLNQCTLLENYLTGYVDPSTQPKPLKDVELDLLSNLLDIYYKPKEDNTIKKGGLDYIINLNTRDDVINERMKNARYDPLTGKIYNENEINNNGKINIDKKIYERLVNEVPDFANDGFENLKNEYIDNWSKIERFYSKFGIEKCDLNNNIKKKEVIHVFQQVDDLENKDDICNYIVDNLIKEIHDENDKKEKKIYTDHQNEVNEDEKEVEKIKIHLNTMKKEKEKEKEIALIADSSNLVYREMVLLADKYDKILKKFISLVDIQYEDLCKRFHLIQKKFEKFLSLSTDKKKLIKLYIKKFNNFITKFRNIANHELVATEFKNDIEDLSSKLWLYVKQKQAECISELNEIFSVGFFENEMYKFYLMILDVFKIETEKYLITLELLFKIYGKKNEEEKDEKEKPLNVDSDIIFEKVKEPKSNNNPLEFYTKNINIIFLNSIRLILGQGERIKEFESQIISTNLNESVYSKKKSRAESSSLATTHTKLYGTEHSNEDKVKKMIKLEKLKYKYRMQVLKYFACDYLERVNYTTDRVRSNMDSWVIMSVRLQNFAVNDVRDTLKKHIEEVTTIPENYFDKIPMDNFENEFEVFTQINYEHILGSKKKESHLYIDFSYDVNALHITYTRLKQYNYENNIMPLNIFMEMFLKEVFFNRNENDKRNNINCISYPLKFLSYKEVMKLIDKFTFSFEPNFVLEENIDYNKDIGEKIIDKEKVFEEYIHYGSVITIIALIGSKVISTSEIKNIESDYNDKLIKGSYISKENFINYKFWFEDDKYLEGKIELLKELLFDIWQDEKGECFNLKEFLNTFDLRKHGGKFKDRLLMYDYYNFAFS